MAERDARDISSAALFQRYREWCGSNNYMPLSSGQFAKEVKRAFRGAESKDRKVNKKNDKHWHGIRWKEVTDHSGYKLYDGGGKQALTSPFPTAGGGGGAAAG